MELPDHVEEIRSRAHIRPAAPSYTSSFDSAAGLSASGADNTYSLDGFKENFKLDIKSKTDEKIVFHMSGIDAPIANALRRILIAEVPTMAIETVNIYNNTSILQDEVLAHRLGLVPIKVDPRLFEYKETDSRDQAVQQGDGSVEDGEGEDETNTLTFHLKVRCTLDLSKDQELPIDERLINGSVYSRQLEWVPIGGQAATFADSPPTVVHPDILLARLRPGQEIDMELKCEKGLGKDHAKWSPVCTAAYRLLPDVKIVGPPILDDEIEQAQMICGADVFDIVERDDGHKEAVLARPHLCSMARNGFTPEWNKRIKIYRIKDHFIFSIESVGQYTAAELFTEALDVFVAKAEEVSNALDAPDGGDGFVRDRTTRT
jgi:DNA-directed RNA polymerase I and III subunit RPAC1